MAGKKAILIGDAIYATFKRLGLEKDYLKAKVVTELSDILGDKLYTNLKVEKFQNDILQLKTESSVLRNELSFRKKEIIEKINTRFNHKMVKDIIIF